jgi:hypothetical protein
MTHDFPGVRHDDEGPRILPADDLLEEPQLPESDDSVKDPPLAARVSPFAV